MCTDIISSSNQPGGRGHVMEVSPEEMKAAGLSGFTGPGSLSASQAGGRFSGAQFTELPAEELADEALSCLVMLCKGTDPLTLA